MFSGVPCKIHNRSECAQI